MIAYNKLTPAEIERLAKLAEECGEVVQCVGKTLIHGWSNFHPRDPEQKSNRAHLEEEVGNILNVVDMMVTAGDLSKPAVRRSKTKKKQTIGKYLHHQETI